MWGIAWAALLSLSTQRTFNRRTGPVVLRGSAHADQHVPPHLAGPWEIRALSSELPDSWVELIPDGTVECSVKLGRGASWFAQLQMNKGTEMWKLHVTIKNKLDRPVTFVGLVQNDDDNGLAVSGDVMGISFGGSSELTKFTEFRGWRHGL